MEKTVVTVQEKTDSYGLIIEQRPFYQDRDGNHFIIDSDGYLVDIDNYCDFYFFSYSFLMDWMNQQDRLS